MKRLLFTLFIAIVVASCAQEQISYTQRKKADAPERHGLGHGFDLYGDVASVVVEHYDLIEESGVVVPHKRDYYEVYHFNTAGDVTDNSSYNIDGTVNWKRVFEYDSAEREVEFSYYAEGGVLKHNNTSKYDSNGNIVEECSYDSDGVVTQKRVCEYDEAGNILTDEYYYSDASQNNYRKTYKYDSVGNLIEENRWDHSDISSNEKRYYKYDSSGNKIEEKHYNSDGRCIGNYIYKYDAAGRLITEEKYDSHDTWAYTYAYNSNGDIIEKIEYRSFNSYADIYSNYHVRTKTIYKYDSAGNKIEEACYSGLKDLSLDWVNSYKYNSEGTLIEEVNNNCEGSMCRVTMYDSAGNRIKRNKYSGDGVLISGETFEYDLAGNLVKWIVYEDGLEYVRSSHEYDAMGNEVVSYWYNNDLQGGSSVRMAVSTITYR